MAYNPSADSVIFSQTADKTLVNSATETTALGAGVGSRMIMANTLAPGKRIRIHGEGVYTIPAILPSSITIKVKIGNTVIGSVTTSSLVTGATNKAFTFDALLVVRTIGATGTCVIGGTASYTTATGSKQFDDIDNTGNAATIDTTVDQVVDVTLQWDSATTSRSIKTTIATIMVV